MCWENESRWQTCVLLWVLSLWSNKKRSNMEIDTSRCSCFSFTYCWKRKFIVGSWQELSLTCMYVECCHLWGIFLLLMWLNGISFVLVCQNYPETWRLHLKFSWDGNRRLSRWCRYSQNRGTSLGNCSSGSRAGHPLTPTPPVCRDCSWQRSPKFPLTSLSWD